MVTGYSKSKTWRSRAARCLTEAAGNPKTMASAITSIVSDLLDQVPCPPTDLSAIERKVGVYSCVAEDIAGSGELRRDESGLRIVYSCHLPKPRRRFTIAHELAHAYFETRWPGLPGPSKEVEQLCDMMAAEILMPSAHVLELIKGGLRLEQVFETARAFDVSLSASAIRCANLKSVTVFEVNGGRVTWGSGSVRRGSVSKLSEGLQSVVFTATAGQRGEDQLFFDSETGLRPWRVEYQAIGKDRALLLLQPYSARSSYIAASP
jgi:Zn-dependent peptidase ImmA (M78 family)